MLVGENKLMVDGNYCKFTQVENNLILTEHNCQEFLCLQSSLQLFASDILDLDTKSEDGGDAGHEDQKFDDGVTDHDYNIIVVTNITDHCQVTWVSAR